jgi:chemotaxis signal transduction protein
MVGTKAGLDRRVLTFRAGDGSFGIPLDWVCSVYEGGAEAGAEGKLQFRERELPLVDLAKWFGAEGGEAKFPSLLVIGEGEGVAALKVDSPGMAVNGHTMQDWPALCRDLVEGVFQGVIVDGEKLILVVDPESICRTITGEIDGSSRGGARG